jgi:hypothetical protein
VPIREYLHGQTFDPDTIRILGLAFEITRIALKVEPLDEAAKKEIVRRLIELVKEGERDPERLSERLLAQSR